jgi:hypothetical protein
MQIFCRKHNYFFQVFTLLTALIPSLHSPPLTLRQAINLALARNQTILFYARESHASSQAAVAFVFVGTSAAAPGGEVKSSPLFKRSLEESIAKLEGKAPEATAQAEAEAMPTGRPGCPKPNQLQTEAGDTCYDSCSGTCGATCGGPFTCGGSTCGGATCSSTCAGGSCQYHYIWRGLNKWNYNGQESANWYGLSWHGYSVWWGSNPETTIEFLGSGAPPDEGTSWLLQDGFYEIDK